MISRIAAMLVLVCLAAPAMAQTRQEQWDRCNSKNNHDLAIGACSALIQSGTETDASLSSLFMNRGNSYHRKGDLERARPATISGQGLLARQQGNYALALELFTAALLLSPQPPTQATASLISNRGITYLLMGRYDEALVDLNSSLSINPKYAFGLFARGVTKRRKGDLAGGDADIEAAKAIQSNVEAAMARRKVVI